ncbi:Peptidoglycan/LPS O-acetylase OafA/YrhL, contains acyltransferase and SGNH-hydrolase domains [Pseudomonas sp. LAMO17WK12:I6]|jgi:peptidoglycan/LPS O-acetylase OafA/YrhL|uniref:acyltransferase family protein n=1 Tax=unclassified Pseudomonas TaxID=196821 RepID=UPI000BD56C68|nr:MULTISPECIES: acyltransferase [unclassified Pseudomonas]SNY45722.1 Peptidoglycan/LPS O-acetylase OafA/YrhL, contains acyltransferase and SGNH-hydrolase domains [Pseudomonas sp. LAMO17WK12:I6]SNY45724.1 Peptidoglycan/LPS O-acetylase OafA/YrhL, contains acyltransferase and SGNH-hydrolase domains [Pseudomonas sp. LAMO17WK12:I5]
MNSKRIMDIEVLRAIAVLGVLFHHLQGSLFTDTVPLLQTVHHWAQSWWGVDLFFAISGFVIARSLIPVLQGCTSRRQCWEQTRNFWLRRAFRLLPSAWLWLALMLLACVLLNRSGAFGTLHANLQATLAGVLQYANFRFADSFFQYEYGSSFVYWSLALEEQFYLLFPLLIVVCRRHLGWVLLALVAVQLFTLRTPLLMVVRTDALALGVLLAMWSAQPGYSRWEPRFLRRPWAGVSVLIVLALLLSYMATDRFTFASYRIGSIAMLSALLVWIASYNRDYLLPRGRLQQLMAWIGSRSYGIYVIHIPAYLLVRELIFRLQDAGLPSPAGHPILTVLIAGGLIALLSELNYRFIEMPMRNRGAALVRRLGTSRTAVPSSGATSC